MDNNKSAQIVDKAIHIIEMAIIIMIGIGIVMKLPSLFTYLIEFTKANDVNNFDTFQRFLESALILVVGIELILMIITPKPEAILNLIIFVVGRHALLHANGMVDLLIATITICIALFSKKFLESKKLFGKDVE